MEHQSGRSLVRWDPEVFGWSAPESERAGRPLLVMLHGLGADETDLAALNPYLPPQLVTVAVRAPLLYGERFAWFDRTRPADEATADAREGQRVLRDWVGSLRGHSSLGVLGFSQGAAVAVDLLRTDAELVDYVVQIAGFLPPTAAEDATPSRSIKVPVFSGHGDRDHVIPDAEALQLSDWLRVNSDLTEHRYPDASHEISAEMLDDFVPFLEAHAR